MTIGDAKAEALIVSVNLLGKDYIKKNVQNMCISYPQADVNEYEIFLGFERNLEKELWTVFTRILINRTTEKSIVLDYKLPDRERMESPVNPVRWA